MKCMSQWLDVHCATDDADRKQSPGKNDGSAFDDRKVSDGNHQEGAKIE